MATGAVGAGRRHEAAIRADIDVPRGDFLGQRGTAKAELGPRAARLCIGRGNQAGVQPQNHVRIRARAFQPEPRQKRRAVARAVGRDL